MTDDLASIPIGEFAFPGPLRDRLVAAILDGTKTATSSLLIEFEGEPLPRIGEQEVVIDSDEAPVAVIEVTGVEIMRLADVGDAFARDEGEGFGDHAEWRIGHEEFWHSDEMRDELGDAGFTVGDDTQVVLVRFVLLRRL